MLVLPHKTAAGRSLTAQRAAPRERLLGLDTQSKALRVLAFGDSITEGWIHTSRRKVPWTPAVQTQLQSTLGPEWSVEVVNGGTSQVVGQLRHA
jgi:lysophospholipase L1-like esterase